MVVQVIGELDAGSVGEVESYVAAIEPGCTTVILDLRLVTVLDAPAIDGLDRLHRDLGEQSTATVPSRRRSATARTLNRGIPTLDAVVQRTAAEVGEALRASRVLVGVAELEAIAARMTQRDVANAARALEAFAEAADEPDTRVELFGWETTDG